MAIPQLVALVSLGCSILLTANIIRSVSSLIRHNGRSHVRSTPGFLTASCCIAAVGALLSASYQTDLKSSNIAWITPAAWAAICLQCIISLFCERTEAQYYIGRDTAASCLLAVVAQLTATYIAIEGTPRGQLELGLAGVQVASSLYIAWVCVHIPRGSLRFSDGGRAMEPDIVVALWQKLTFAWATPLLKSSRRNARVEVTDLHALERGTAASLLHLHFRTVRSAIQQPFWMLLFKSHKTLFISQWLLAIVISLISFIPQISVYYLLLLLEQQDVERVSNDRALPCVWAIVLGACSVGIQILSTQMDYFCFAKIEVYLRAQLCALIYEKALKLDDLKGASRSIAPSSEHNGDSGDEEEADDTTPLAGQQQQKADTPESVPAPDTEQKPSKHAQQVLNLITLDTHSVAHIAARQYVFLAGPLKFILALVFLVRLVGWTSFLLGLLGPLAVLPLSRRAFKGCFGAQVGLMKSRDDKLQAFTEVLHGIKQIKFTATEKRWEHRLMELREAELTEQRKIFVWSTVVLFLFQLSPIALAMITLSVYAVLNDSLSAPVAFTALALFGNLEFSINVLPPAWMELTTGLISANRIQEFLETPEKKASTTPGNCIRLQNATISWPDGNVASFCLRDVEAEFPRRALSVIRGPSGSGKSLLLHALIGEAQVIEGHIVMPQQNSAAYTIPSDAIDREEWIQAGSLAYVSQIPWIENASIQSNILFGLPMDATRYRAVLQGSALLPDLKILPDGDLTEIGARGVNLSGGQRWRLTFARALYSRAEILVLDDIFSAVDSHVGALLLETLTGKLCRGRTRVLATHHATMCLPKAACILTLNRDGSVASVVTRSDDPSEIMSATDPQMDDGHDRKPLEATSDLTDGQPLKFVQDESRDEGAIKWRTCHTYIKAAGGTTIGILAVLLVFVYQVALLSRVWWIKIWTSSPQSESSNPGASITGTHGTAFYLAIYVGISLSGALMEGVKCAFIYAAALRGSRALFNQMLHSVLRAKLRWLDTTPTGRILNRVTADFLLVDGHIPGDTHTLLSATFALIVVSIACLKLSPYVSISVFLVSLLTFYWTVRFLPTAREVRRLEATAQSPMLELCETSLSGLGTIRAFRVSERYLLRMWGLVDDYSSISQTSELISQWLALRMGILGALYTLSVALTIAMVPGIGVSLAGLALTFVGEFGSKVDKAVRQYSSLQLNMNSTERILEYANMDVEQDRATIQVKPSWPSHGQISFRNVSASYAPDLPSVLNGLTADIRPGERIGIVGRTGAGKSSLSLALFRFLELSEGQISIDDVDIAKISLKDLRSNMYIIPQDPVLFSGDIRSNLDPFSDHTDDELLESLTKVCLTSSSAPLSSNKVRNEHYTNIFDSLDSPLSKQGLNLSQGQRQLLCLARATLVQPTIMVLDEATSAVDRDTDERIQRTIRASFPDTTLLVVAHRLSTVADFDRIMVMDDGRIVEIGEPKKLFRAGGPFRALVESSSEKARLCEILSDLVK